MIQRSIADGTNRADSYASKIRGGIVLAGYVIFSFAMKAMILIVRGEVFDLIFETL